MTLNPQILSSVKQGWVKISGEVFWGTSPLCSLVLANGQHMFSCAGDGKYELEVPLDANGEIILYGFCEGLQPFKQVLSLTGDSPKGTIEGKCP